MWFLGRAEGSVVVCGWHLEGGSFLHFAAQVQVWSR